MPKSKKGAKHQLGVVSMKFVCISIVAFSVNFINAFTDYVGRASFGSGNPREFGYFVPI
jgi:hypothetical protein